MLEISCCVPIKNQLYLPGAKVLEETGSAAGQNISSDRLHWVPLRLSHVTW
jgi:hypothetical protein